MRHSEKRKKGHYGFFTFCLDLAVLNARAIQCVLDNTNILENRQAKQSIFICLVANYLQHCRTNSPNKRSKNMPLPTDNNNPSDDEDNTVAPVVVGPQNNHSPHNPPSPFARLTPYKGRNYKREDGGKTETEDNNNDNSNKKTTI